MDAIGILWYSHRCNRRTGRISVALYRNLEIQTLVKSLLKSNEIKLTPTTIYLRYQRNETENVNWLNDVIETFSQKNM